MEGLLQNSWYMAGWEHELADGKFARRIADIPVVVFRGENGEIGAVHDRCPHRFAPLSMGSVEGNNIVCPYHGLGFNNEGHCKVNPFSSKIPAGSSIRSFKVVPKYSALWMWLGAPEKADESLIPDYSFIVDTDSNKVIRDVLHLKANFESIIDNVMDLTHIEWCHRNSFGGRGLIQLGQHKTMQKEDGLWINWSFQDIPWQPMPIHKQIPWERVDMWIETRWSAPANCVLNIYQTKAGTPRDDGLHQHLAHIITPETATTSHYFWAVSRQHELDSKEEDARIYNMLRGAFEMEDVPVIEAAQAAMEGENFWDLKPVTLGPDVAGTRVRRALEAMVRKEQNEAAQTEAA